jgi:hypothetical protein
MGKLVVTIATPVGCSHATPPAQTGGQVTPDEGDATLTVGGQAVRTVKKVAGQNIDPSGCAQPGTQTNPKCTTVGPALTLGTANVLTINGDPVVRADLSAQSFFGTVLNGKVLAGSIEHDLLSTD